MKEFEKDKMMSEKAETKEAGLSEKTDREMTPEEYGEFFRQEWVLQQTLPDLKRLGLVKVIEKRDENNKVEKITIVDQDGEPFYFWDQKKDREIFLERDRLLKKFEESQRPPEV